jgi:hypothetical protein
MAYHLPPRQTVWVIQVGLEDNLAFDLESKDGSQALVEPRTFGACASVFGFHVR